MDKIVVLLIGAQGSGKTTYCTEHLSDYLRISQDDQGVSRHLELYQEALERDEPRIVIDRINASKFQRARYLNPARERGYHTRIIWLNVDREKCLRRCKEREHHPTLRPTDAEKAIANFFRGLQLPSRMEADELQIIGPAPSFVPIRDLTAEIGDRRYLIVGDVHGCSDELLELLQKVDFDPDDDVLISVGDIIDRGPRIKDTVTYLRSLPRFHMVLGNHEDKFRRYLHGSDVKLNGGLQETIDSFDDTFPDDLRDWLDALPRIIKTPSGFVVHAGFDPEMTPEEQRPQDCIYMRYYGGRTYFDEINGQLWYELWPKDQPRVFFGHIPTDDGPFEDHVVSLDGGCVFGGELRLFDSRDQQIHTVQARDAYAISTSTKAASLSAIQEIQRREEYVQDGLLRSDRSDDGSLVIYTYTDVCTFRNAWDEITLNARGHIFNLHTGECVASPFPKFFNLDENNLSGADQFDWDQPYEIFEKMDGWLGVLYRHDGEFHMATRGSFHSPGARSATNQLQQHDLSCLPDEVTLCFELIAPEQRIILDYGEKRDLVILAAFNRFTGEEYPRAQVEEWATKTGLSIVPMQAHMSLEELLRSKKELEHHEGFVIRFHDGRRVKVKTEWYMDLARKLTKLSPISVWEALHRGKLPEPFLVDLPEELLPLAERYKETLESQYAQVLESILSLVEPLRQEHGEDRRSLALALEKRKEELGYRRNAVFLVFDGKESKLDSLIKRIIRPDGNQFVENIHS